METHELNIPVLIGTAREGRRSEFVARYVHEKFKGTGVTTDIVDVKDYNLGVTTPSWNDNPKTRPWQDISEAADGFIIVTPEYNYGYPGELKMLLDQALDEYRRKPVGICGVSSGVFGGARAVEALKLTAARIGLVPIHPPAYFGNVGELFDEGGQMTDPEYGKFVEPMFAELIWYTKALKTARANG